jgi:hypothetical protein
MVFLRAHIIEETVIRVLWREVGFEDAEKLLFMCKIQMTLVEEIQSRGQNFMRHSRGANRVGATRWNRGPLHFKTFEKAANEILLHITIRSLIRKMINV